MKVENIKFKAKRLDNGKWAEGSLVTTKLLGWDEPMTEIIAIDGTRYEVDPSTVCQFTGLRDCKGKEIFEHDLIHFVGFSYTGEVIWSEGKYSFMVVCYNKHSYWLHDVIEVCRIERIGNKFDNEK